VEWWREREQGLEQGWDVAAPPLGEGPLRITVAWGGARVESDGERLLLTAGLHRFHYGPATAYDARGRALPATLDTDGVVVDDRGAAYPITVDPLVTVAATQVDGANGLAGLGDAVASAGDVDGDGFGDVIIGASGEGGGGQAWVYFGGPSGLDTASPWMAEAVGSSDLYGSSVGSAGDVNGDGYADVLVGASAADNGQTDEGVV
jgi:hypothetical protein